MYYTKRRMEEDIAELVVFIFIWLIVEMILKPTGKKAKRL